MRRKMRHLVELTTPNDIQRLPASPLWHTTTDHRQGLAGWFAVSASVILAVTGLAKVYGAGGEVKLLTVVDHCRHSV
jgi:hypothetical protein